MSSAATYRAEAQLREVRDFPSFSRPPIRSSNSCGGRGPPHVGRLLMAKPNFVLNGPDLNRSACGNRKTPAEPRWPTLKPHAEKRRVPRVRRRSTAGRALDKEPWRTGFQEAGDTAATSQSIRLAARMARSHVATPSGRLIYRSSTSLTAVFSPANRFVIVLTCRSRRPASSVGRGRPTPVLRSMRTPKSRHKRSTDRSHVT